MSAYSRGGKRFFDLISSLILAAAITPIALVLGMAVRLFSGRPVLYRQLRAGKDGRPFELVKFRTMRVGTHERSGGYPSSDMVTTVGAFLRATSLDEVPQLLNIIKGDMSMVGPRPALVEQAARYSDEQRLRLSVRPGLTGLAQIKYRNNAPWSLRIVADLQYVRDISFSRDLAILVRTIPVVLKSSGISMGQTREDVDDLGLVNPTGETSP